MVLVLAYSLFAHVIYLKFFFRLCRKEIFKFKLAWLKLNKTLLNWGLLFKPRNSMICFMYVLFFKIIDLIANFGLVSIYFFTITLNLFNFFNKTILLFLSKI